MKTLILTICLSASSLWAGEIVYSTSTLQIVEAGVGDKSRFIGDPNYVIVEVPDSEIKKVDGNLRKFVFNPATNRINGKPAQELNRLARIENKEKIVSLKSQLASLQSLRASETDEETLTIIDQKISRILESITKLE